jgi:hypothetical protein
MMGCAKAVSQYIFNPWRKKGGEVKMASHAAEQVEEEAADLQFPKGNCIIMRTGK